MPTELLLFILKGLRHRSLRSWLTIVGIVIGIMLVVAIFALGSGIQNAVAQLLNMFGSDFLIVFPGKETNPFLGLVGGQKFRVSDLKALEEISGVKFAVPMNVATLNLEYRGEKKSILVHAAPWKEMKEIFEASQGIKLEAGRWPVEERAPETVLGYLAAHGLFKQDVAVGDEVIIKARRMKVVGIVARIGIREDDNTVYISDAVFRELTGTPALAGTAFVKVEPGADMNLVARQVSLRLSRQDVVRDFTVLTPEKASRLVGDVLSLIEIGLIVIAGISLLVGAVGITNTMYTSVLERTRQIGVMKAVGASSDHILSLFLIESGVIGLVGGVLGVVFGIGMAYIAGLAAAQFGIRGLFSFASLDLLGLAAILIVAFITGIIAGVLPARQAAKMEPAEALRYE